MSITHTPAPWRICGRIDGRLVIEAADGEDIALMVMDHDQKQNDANAKLIAASPLLFDALTRLVQSYQRQDGEAGDARFYADDIEAARAAITKATGGAQ